MEANNQFFRRIKDPRGYKEELNGSASDWRLRLRKDLFIERFGRSDLTQTVLFDSFDLHEGLFQRRWVGKESWQHYLFAGPNCFLLRIAEHRIETPDRTMCYWLSVVRYGKLTVDTWINSLPFKVRPDTPWSGTCGLDIISTVPEKYEVKQDWYRWFEKNKKILDSEA